MKNKIIGTPGKITVQEDEQGNFVIDIDPTYGGQVSIHTLGTITTGLYRGYAIEPEYGGTGCNNTGVISTAGDVTITGSLTLMCNPEMQSVLKIPEVQGTVALQENSLQTQNCFSEFSDEQAIKAFDEIAPTFEKGQIIAHNGKQNTAIDIGKLNQFLGIDGSTGMPTYKFLPNIYSSVVNDPTFTFAGNYETIAFWPKRTVLNFASYGFKISDGGISKGTIVELDSRIESLLKLTNGLWVIGYEYDDECSFDPEQKYSFAKRQLNAGDYISIKNGDFIKDSPRISLSKNYPGQPSIKTVGTIKEGVWESEVIKPQFGGTGCINELPIIAKKGMILDVPLLIEGKEDDGLIFEVDGLIDLKVYDSGTLATLEKTLQVNKNLEDIAQPLEAFRHLSPTKKRGDIIARGYGDYDTVIEVGNDGDLLVADSNSNASASYKHPKDIDTLREYINEVFESKLEEAKQDLKRVLKMYEDYDTKISKRIDTLCVQFDYMSRNKQLNLTKELQAELKEWTDEKTKANH